MYGLKKPAELFVLVVTLLANGCPPQAIVAAFGLDPRTVARWQQRAGEHARQVHEHVIGQSQLDLGQVQADEIKVKTQRGYLWLALAIMVSTRLWIAGAVSPHRDKALVRQVANQKFVRSGWWPRLYKRWVKRTPAMAAQLTDYRWSIHELLHFKVPTRFIRPKKRGRPPKFRCSCGFSSPHYSV